MIYFNLFKDDPRWNTRGYGIDSAILNACMYIGQLTVSFCVGGIVEASGTRDAAAMVMGGCLVISSILSLFIIEVSVKPSQPQADLTDFEISEEKNNNYTAANII